MGQWTAELLANIFSRFSPDAGDVVYRVAQKVSCYHSTTAYFFEPRCRYEISGWGDLDQIWQEE